jgi:hypothetical protein
MKAAASDSTSSETRGCPRFNLLGERATYRARPVSDQRRSSSDS